jgi:hypothetical protein
LDCSEIPRAAIEVTIPVGEYFDERLVNLGSNRWVYRPHIGAVHTALACLSQINYDWTMLAEAA